MFCFVAHAHLTVLFSFFLFFLFFTFIFILVAANFVGPDNGSSTQLHK